MRDVDSVVIEIPGKMPPEARTVIVGTTNEIYVNVCLVPLEDLTRFRQTTSEVPAIQYNGKSYLDVKVCQQITKDNSFHILENKIRSHLLGEQVEDLDDWTWRTVP